MTAEADCRAALYLRLSRDDTGRAGESESIANQRRLLHDYALRQGWPVVAEYADDGVSGTTFDRPQFQKMLCEIPQRGINLILIKDLSRLGRDYLETGRYLERYFPEHGVRVIAVGDAVDTAHEDIFLPMRNYINELYARDTSGKIRAALQTKMKDGRFIGHYAPYGYRRDPQERPRSIAAAHRAANGQPERCGVSCKTRCTLARSFREKHENRPLNREKSVEQHQRSSLSYPIATRRSFRRRFSSRCSSRAGRGAFRAPLASSMCLQASRSARTADGQ